MLELGMHRHFEVIDLCGSDDDENDARGTKTPRLHDADKENSSQEANPACRRHAPKGYKRSGAPNGRRNIEHYLLRLAKAIAHTSKSKRTSSQTLCTYCKLMLVTCSKPRCRYRFPTHNEMPVCEYYNRIFATCRKVCSVQRD